MVGDLVVDLLGVEEGGLVDVDSEHRSESDQPVREPDVVSLAVAVGHPSGQHPRPVLARPPEVGRAGEGELLGGRARRRGDARHRGRDRDAQPSVDPEETHRVQAYVLEDRRELRGVAEAIGEPRCGRVEAQVPAHPGHAPEIVADQGLPGRQHGIGTRESPPDDPERPAFGVPQDPLPLPRILVPEPPEEADLGDRVPVAGLLIEDVERPADHVLDVALVVPVEGEEEVEVHVRGLADDQHARGIGGNAQRGAKATLRQRELAPVVLAAAQGRRQAHGGEDPTSRRSGHGGFRVDPGAPIGAID